MSKKNILLVIILFCLKANAQYYNAAGGIAGGTPLKLALHNIIKNHTPLSYNDLWNAFTATDSKSNGNVWDIYSFRFSGAQPYEHSHFTDQCGQYSQEGDCYNREHTWPQTYFNSTMPMQSDLFQVYPTDGEVNGIRGNLPYGVVASANKVTLNNSKRGASNTYPNNSDVFEPIDSFKGDLARTYFYMATRYYTEGNTNWTNWEMANGPDLTPAAITLLLNWHHLDPVSQKEVNRNNAIFARQGNRNPFIDFPEYADCIWGTGNCSTVSINTLEAVTNIQIYPNPASNILHIEMPVKIVNINAIVVNSVGVEVLNKPLANNILSIGNLPYGVYFLKLVTPQGVFNRKFIKQ